MIHAPRHDGQLVLVVVVMPIELAERPDQLDLLPVQLPNDLRRPLLVERPELLRQVHLLHSQLLTSIAAPPTGPERLITVPSAPRCAPPRF
jgi:hypothetical protein